MTLDVDQNALSSTAHTRIGGYTYFIEPRSGAVLFASLDAKDV
jgi:hypothetical protein